MNTSRGRPASPEPVRSETAWLSAETKSVFHPSAWLRTCNWLMQSLSPCRLAAVLTSVSGHTWFTGCWGLLVVSKLSAPPKPRTATLDPAANSPRAISRAACCSWLMSAVVMLPDSSTAMTMSTGLARDAELDDGEPPNTFADAYGLEPFPLSPVNVVNRAA